jgi:glycosyltransferase involved in cell wall biosynthesis
VLFPGYRRHDLPEYLAALDAALWLVPGNDATSRAVLQAMATELPVIGGSQGAIAEVLDDGQSGLLVHPEEPADVARAMVHLASQADLRTKMGVRGRTKVLAQHTQERRGQRLLGLYRRVLGVTG